MGEQILKSELFTIESSRVTSTKIYEKGKPGRILVLHVTVVHWNVRPGNKTSPADTNLMTQLIRGLKKAGDLLPDDFRHPRFSSVYDPDEIDTGHVS
jgi:hypothetical protein